VAHQRRCPACEKDDARCRCEPSWRGRRHNRLTGKAEWQKPVTKDRSEVLSWLGIGKRAASHARTQANAPRAFESIGDEWLDGVETGRISRRKGRSKPDSATTLADYPAARIGTSCGLNSARCLQTTLASSNGRCGTTG
jgi:hypothetical protein